MPLGRGSRLGPYEILAPLGADGMGEVYLARDTRLSREVAIKILSSRFAASAERRARFLHEARATSALNHPNIVSLYDIGSEDGSDFLVMELVRGRTLDQLIGNRGLPSVEALKIAIPIAEAVACAHAAGIQHRDMKPSNVMITGDGIPKVLDFGLAKLIETPAETSETRTLAAESHSQDGVVAGTPAYMSPEQAEGKKLDARSDIFSFGAVLYETITGRRAFRGDSMVSTLAAVLREEPESPTRLTPDTPLQLERIIQRCLRKDPNRRYQQAADLKIALEDALADVETAHRLSGSSPAVAWARRTRFLWPAVAAAALVTAAISWWYRAGTPPLPDLALVRLTGDPGLTTTPAISPDGRLITYASDRAGHGNLDIWVQHRGGGGPILVASEPGDKFAPSFSADGSQIVYSGAEGIYVVPALGGEPRRLVKGYFSSARFSPDGKQIVYTTRAGGNPNGRKIYLLEIRSDRPRVVSGDLRGCANPAWSPDGRQILFSAGEALYSDRFSAGDNRFPGKDWWLLTVATGTSEGLGPGPGLIHQWLSRDWILFSQQRGGDDRPTSLFAVKISRRSPRFAGKPRCLTNGPVLLESPSVAEDGSFALAVASYRSNLWSLPVNTDSGKVLGEPVALTEDVAVNAYPSISADGKKLAFISDSSSRNKVWIMNLETRLRRLLTPTETPEWRPILSPDGTKVAFLSRGSQLSPRW